jgi:hypothetical protein
VLARWWHSPHRGISKDKLTQYLCAFSYAASSSENPAGKHSDTLSKRLYEINNVLHMSAVHTPAPQIHRNNLKVFL